MAVIGDVYRAEDLADLLTRVAEADVKPRVLAGGTDLLLRYSAAPEESLELIDVTHVDELAGIRETDDGLRIGAAVSLSEVMRSTMIQEHFGVLADGAGSVAGPQIRNLATLGGNVCNASPSADTAPPLLVLDAIAEIQSATVRRTLPLDQFFRGPGKTALEPNEVLVGFSLKFPAPGTVASYTKVSPRQAMDLAVVGVAISLTRSPGGIAARIALGAVAPTPLRATTAEEYLSSIRVITADVAAEAAGLAEAAVSPIDDVRGSAHYRRAMVRSVVARDLLRANEQFDKDGVIT